MAIKIYTDGGYNWTSTVGGWAYLIKNDEEMCSDFGAELCTSNSRMELLAAIKALESVTDPITGTVYSDSKYVIKGITTWIDSWKENGWGKIKNRDLWERLDAARIIHTLEWEWVRGHSGNTYNTYVDKLAGEAIKRLTVPAKTAKI